MARKYGGKEFSDPNDFKLRKTDSNPWEASSSRQGYTGERWNDDRGFVKGLGAYSGDDTDAFLRPSQTRTDHGDGRDSVESIFGDVMAEQGQGPYGAGGSPVRQVGGGSGPPRFKPKSSKQAQDDQSNDGL
jgi:hypothetical protein